MRVVAFNIESNFGFFKTFSSSTSPVTHGVIPKTTVAGLIGAIIGEFNGTDERDNYLSTLNSDKFKIAIQVLNPIKTTSFGVNYQNIKDMRVINKASVKKTSKKSKNHISLLEDYFEEAGNFYDRKNKYTQVNLQVVKQPKYRIFAYISDKSIYNQLVSRLKNNESYYPTFMGTTDFPLTISDVKELELKKVIDNKEPKEMHSVIPYEDSLKVHYKFSMDTNHSFDQIVKEIQPYNFITTDNGRKNNQFIKILYDISGKTIKVNASQYYNVVDENKVKSIILY